MRATAQKDRQQRPKRKQPDAAFLEDIVAEVRQDYDRRIAERRQIEAQWQLNVNFAQGNQNTYIGIDGEIEDMEREHFWQEREVYNHIASIVESRLSKLSRVRPKMAIMPASGDDDDQKTAKTATKILNAACERLELDDILTRGAMWSELTGSVFYKVVWDQNAGRKVGSVDGRPVYEGDVRIDVCPPYEILPDHLTRRSVEECGSLIHAKALTVDEIEQIWGERVNEEPLDLMTLSGTSTPVYGRNAAAGHALVIERYTRPTREKPMGELAILAGDTLLYYGELPYCNGRDGERGLPFVQQNALTRAGCFYGSSMVERSIPIQRAYNAVKNRKHEFLNRIAAGVLTVEDGSVDTELLAEEGLSPGKILVYRQGATPPKFFNPGTVPVEFSVEEQRLLNEFIDISGISEIMRSSTVPSSVTSGVAIQMLIDQDETRLAVTADAVRRAVKHMARHMLRLYKQFASAMRLSRFVGSEGEIELLSWRASDIGSDDVFFETEGDTGSTIASRQAMLFDLLRAGLLYDENGRLSDAMRYKVLDVFGYGGWEHTQTVKTLHLNRATRENAELCKAEAAVLEIDDHDLHESEHTKYMLSSEFRRLADKDAALSERMLAHIRQHRQFKSVQAQMTAGDVGAEA